MVNLKDHIFSYGIFCGIARLTRGNAVICNIANIVINAIHSVIYVRPVAVAWSPDKCRFNSTIKAVLLCYCNELITRKFEFNASFLRVSDVVFKQDIFCIGAAGMSSIRIALVGGRPICKREASTRCSTTGLDSTNPCLKLFSAVALARSKVMMSVLWVSPCYPDNSEVRKSHSSIFSFCTFSYQIALLELNLIINQIKQWDRFQGKPLRGLTLRREREYQLCITP